MSSNSQIVSKRLIQSLIIVGLTWLPAAATERYFELETGVWLPLQTSSVDRSFRPINIDYSTGWGLGGVFGAAFDNGTRMEYELVYRQAPAKGVGDDMWNFASMLNVWWGFPKAKITPYFGGGFGFARAHTSSPGAIDETGGGISYQIGGGIDIRLVRSMTLDIGYRYFGISDASNSGGIGNIDLSGSTIMSGIRIGFL